MNKQPRILLVIDEQNDDRALLSEIRSIVRDRRSHVDILSVTNPAPDANDRNTAVSNLQKWEARLRFLRLKELSSVIVGMGNSIAIEHVMGKTHLETIRKVQTSKYDLVVKLATQESGLRDKVFGGTDVQLLSLCPVPVWIVQPTENSRIKKVGVAIDLAPDDRVRTELADSILHWGVRTARLAAAELHLIHVWSLYRESTLRSWPTSKHMVDGLLQGKEQLHGRWLNEAFEKLPPNNLVVHRHLIKGDARQSIPTLADELELDLLVMGTVGRTGIPGFFIGNTADSVLRQIGCSVLAIKPRDFVTPVQLAPAETEMQLVVNG